MSDICEDCGGPAHFGTQCPDCDAIIKMPNDTVDGEVVTCAECGESWEIKMVHKDHVGLRKAEKMAEDWGE